jgi:hypothetical protein
VNTRSIQPFSSAGNDHQYSGIDQHQRVGGLQPRLLGGDVGRYRAGAAEQRLVLHVEARIEAFGHQIGVGHGVGGVRAVMASPMRLAMAWVNEPGSGWAMTMRLCMGDLRNSLTTNSK